MTAIKVILTQFRQTLSTPFIRNISWLGVSELIPRIFRLGIVFILARFLTPYDYGVAAIVATVGEFARMFMEVGIGIQIVQAEQQDLEILCNSGYWLNWVIFLGLFILQCLVAFPISWFYHDSRLVLPICVAAVAYLIVPISAIQASLIYRENRIKITAINNTIQYSLSYILSGLFALMGMGMWSLILPGVLVSPIWVFTHYTNHSWRPTTGFTTKYWKDIFKLGKNIFGVQVLKTLRNNLDYLIIGSLIGIKELGLYYFAFNAGLGLSMSIINALNSAMFPHICAVRSDWFKFKQRYLSSLKTIGIIIIPFVFLQASLAHLYVPVLFGQKWVVAIPVLVLICLSAIPRPFADAASWLLLAVGKSDLDLRWNVLYTAMLTAGLLVGVHWQAVGVATSVLVVNLICLPLFTIWTTRYVFNKVVVSQISTGLLKQ